MESQLGVDSETGDTQSFPFDTRADKEPAAEV